MSNTYEALITMLRLLKRTSLISQRSFATAKDVWTKKPEGALPALIIINDVFVSKQYTIRKDIQKLQFTEYGFEGNVLDNDGDVWCSPIGWGRKITSVLDKNGTHVTIGRIKINPCGCKGAQECGYYNRDCVGQRSEHTLIHLEKKGYAMSFDNPTWPTPIRMLQTIEDCGGERVRRDRDPLLIMVRGWVNPFLIMVSGWVNPLLIMLSGWVICVGLFMYYGCDLDDKIHQFTDVKSLETVQEKFRVSAFYQPSNGKTMHEDQQLLRVMIRQLADEVEVQAFYRAVDDAISELTDQGEIRELQQIVDEIRELRKTQYLENGLIFNAGVWDGHSGGRSISIVRRSDFVMSQNATSPSPPAPPSPPPPSSPSPSPSPPSADEDDAWYYGLLIPAGIIVPLLVVRHLFN